MNINRLARLIDGEVLGITYNNQTEINGAYTCDMLSRVVSSIENNTAWITILNSINVVAVASLSECPCVILAENVKMDSEILKKADENNITILSSPLSAYEICGLIYQALENNNEKV